MAAHTPETLMQDLDKRVNQLLIDYANLQARLELAETKANVLEKRIECVDGTVQAIVDRMNMVSSLAGSLKKKIVSDNPELLSDDNV
jgi:hypothetical protein